MGGPEKLTLSIETLLEYFRVRVLGDMPDQDTLQQIVLTFFNEFHYDGIKKLDHQLALYDGCIIRTDATFAAVKGLGHWVLPSEVQQTELDPAIGANSNTAGRYEAEGEYPTFPELAEHQEALEEVRRQRLRGVGALLGYNMVTVEGQLAAVGESRMTRHSSNIQPRLGHTEKKVWAQLSTCLITVLGKDGFVMRAPDVASSESHANVRKSVEPILAARKDAYGINGMPDAMGTDNSRRDADFYLHLIKEIWADLLGEEHEVCVGYVNITLLF